MINDKTKSILITIVSITISILICCITDDITLIGTSIGLSIYIVCANLELI